MNARAVDDARRRMLAADNAKNAAANRNDLWTEWQRAATTYWLLLHPELERYRRGDPQQIPTVSEMQERADLIKRATAGIPDTWRIAPPSPAKVEYLSRVAWQHELLAALYEPIETAITRAHSDESAIETLVRFIEADVYCFRSGYMKADAIKGLTRSARIGPEAVRRLRVAILAVVDGNDRREFRAYVRLARKVDDASLRGELRARLASTSERSARHARWMLEGLGEQLQTHDIQQH